MKTSVSWPLYYAQHVLTEHQTTRKVFFQKAYLVARKTKLHRQQYLSSLMTLVKGYPACNYDSISNNRFWKCQQTTSSYLLSSTAFENDPKCLISKLWLWKVPKDLLKRAFFSILDKKKKYFHTLEHFWLLITSRFGFDICTLYWIYILRMSMWSMMCKSDFVRIKWSTFFQWLTCLSVFPSSDTYARKFRKRVHAIEKRKKWGRNIWV